MEARNVRHGDEFERFLIDRWRHLGYKKNRNKKGIDVVSDGMPSVEAKSDWTGRTKNICVQIYTVGDVVRPAGPWRAYSEDPGSLYVQGQKVDGKWTFPFVGLSTEMKARCEKYKRLADAHKAKDLKPRFHKDLTFYDDEKVLAKVPRAYLEKVNRGISWADDHLTSCFESYAH